MSKIHKAKYVIKLSLKRTTDTDKVLWLRKVYREWWGEKHYFEFPTPADKLLEEIE